MIFLIKDDEIWHLEVLEIGNIFSGSCGSIFEKIYGGTPLSLKEELPGRDYSRDSDSHLKLTKAHFISLDFEMKMILSHPCEILTFI